MESAGSFEQQIETTGWNAATCSDAVAHPIAIGRFISRSTDNDHTSNDVAYTDVAYTIVYAL